MKYKIILNEYVNEYGKVTDSHYTIKIEKQFLWFNYWSTVKHTVCDVTGCSSDVTRFKTIEDVREYVGKLEKNGKFSHGWNETIVDEFGYF